MHDFQAQFRGTVFVSIFSSKQSIIKQSLDSVCRDIQNDQGLAQFISTWISASAKNTHLDLDYCGYHKTLIQ